MSQVLRILVPSLLGLLAIASLPAQSKADCGGLGLAYMYGYGSYVNTQIRPYVPAPPYFAMHPPVYYGQRYTRPYGVSPFAAWPQLQPSASYAPERHVQRSMIIANPHVSGVAEASQMQIVQSQAVQPLVIQNPYYKQDTVRLTSSAVVE